MSHKSLRLLIEHTAKKLQDDIQYSYGKPTDFNQEEKKRFTLINTSPLTASAAYRNNGVSNYMKQWTVEMAFYKFDKEESLGDEYGAILDQTDSLVDRFVNALNQREDLTISGINQQPFIKALSDILTGHTLTLQVLLNDDFNYCFDCP